MLHVLLAMSCLAITPLFPGRNVDTSRATWSPDVFAKPSTLSMTRNGDVYVLLTSDAGLDAIGVFTGGVPRIIPPPSTDVLASAFHVALRGRDGRAVFPMARLISIAGAGPSPIITASTPFAGGYGGTEDTSFQWTGAAWRPITQTDTRNRKNDWIVSVARGAALYGNDLFADGPFAAKEPWHPEASGALFESGARRIVVHGVVPTEVRKASFLSYRLSLPDFDRPASSPYAKPGERFQSAIPTAAIYSQGRTAVIFKGIAWASDGRHTYVGDNRKRQDEAGSPLVYRGRKPRLLSTQRGTAFGINRAGLVVGSLEGADGQGHAFAYDLSQPSARPVMLDTLLLDRHAHVNDAYAVADDGSILALVSRNRAIDVVRLTPSSLHACKTAATP